MSHAVEKDIFRVRPSFIPVLAVIVGVLLAGTLTAIIIFKVSFVLTYIMLGAIMFMTLIIILSWVTTVYALTTERLEYHLGIIGSKDDSIETERVSSLQLKQGLLGKIFNFGDIFAEGDSAKSEIVFKNIHFAKKRYQQIKHETVDKTNLS